MTLQFWQHRNVRSSERCTQKSRTPTRRPANFRCFRLGTPLANDPGMRGHYIDTISSYCDSWCERCAFTDRCAVYAIKMAIEMCDGDCEAGVELAVGAAPPTTEDPRGRYDSPRDTCDISEITRAALDECQREQDEQEERLQQLPVTTTAATFTLLAHTWLDRHRDADGTHPTPEMRNAIDVARWDCYLIQAKVRRALSGRDDAVQHGWAAGEDPVQNDWNGSAKVALISIERSIAAWDVIASATMDADATQVVETLRNLQHELDTLFPAARQFHRPGFDGPVRKRRWRW
jgi:hypothetical protein